MSYIRLRVYIAARTIKPSLWTHRPRLHALGRESLTLTSKFDTARRQSKAMATMSAPPPALSHVLETCIYVKSMPEAAAFYKDIMQLKPYLETTRITAFAMGHTTLLLFQLGSTVRDVNLPGGCIPHHGPTQPILELLKSASNESTTPQIPPNSLQQHFCLGVANKADVDSWEAWLKEKNVKLLGTMEWERGGKSVYFEDPDGHIGEVGSRGIWEHY